MLNFFAICKDISTTPGTIMLSWHLLSIRTKKCGKVDKWHQINLFFFWDVVKNFWHTKILLPLLRIDIVVVLPF